MTPAQRVYQKILAIADLIEERERQQREQDEQETLKAPDQQKEDEQRSHREV